MCPAFYFEDFMQVTIKYNDDSSFTAEEVVKLAESNYGKNVRVEVTASSAAPHDQIYFAIQQIITHRQLAILYDNKHTYQKDLQLLRAETLSKITEILDSVIIDNESKVS